MRVLKICLNVWENASHDKRELSVCRELGAETVVLAKGNPDDHGREDMVDGYKVYRYTTRPFKCLPVFLNRILAIFMWAKYASDLNADVITGRNMDGWTIGWLSRFFSKGKKPVLVYDSHEFELGVDPKRNRFQLAVVKFWEKQVFRLSAFSIVVNDLAADELVRIYRLSKRPVVARNIPSKWDIDRSVCEKTRKELLSMFRVEDDGAGYEKDSFILMYHGGIIPERGLEELIRLVSMNASVKAVILGNGDEAYKESLTRLAETYHVSDRILFHPAVPLAQLWKYVGAADVGMIIYRAFSMNHFYSLPNKYFENIQAGTPVICPDFPVLSQVVNQFKNGLLCNPDDLDDINRCVERLRTDKELYAKLKRNTMKARETLNWEQEKKGLLAAYSDLLYSG